MKKWMKDGNFIAFSDEEVKELSTEDLATYTADKIANDSKETVDSIKSDITELKKNAKEYASSIDLTNQVKKIEASIKVLGEDKTLKDEVTSLEGLIKKLGTDFKALDEKPSKKEAGDLKDLISKELRKNADKLKGFKDSDTADNKLVFIVKGTVIRSDISGDTVSHYVDGVGQIQRRRPFIRELFTGSGVDPNNHGSIRYTDQETQTVNSAMIAEAASFPSSDIDWQERQLPIEKAGDTIKISREMMDDVDFVESEINNFLLRNVKLTIDTQLLSGNGASPNLVGMASSATSFAAGNFADSIQDASYYDLITVIGAQIMTGTNFMPTAALMHPTDATKMKLKKDGENNYMLPPFVVSTPDGNFVVDGMIVVPNSGVTVNTMYVGDFTRGTVYSSGEFQIEMGFVNDDFAKDLVTVKARERLALLIRNVDTGAFVKVTDIATAITAIEESVD